MGKSRKNGLVSLAALLLFAIPMKSANSAVTTGDDSKSSKYSADENAIRAQAEEYAKLFAGANANALANMWTADGILTDSEGHEFKGRASIQKMFESSFKSAPNQSLDVVVDSVKFPSSTTAIEEGTTRVRLANMPVSMSRYMVFHVKNNGKWQMAAVSETSCMPSSSYECLKDLSWLIGDWTMSGPGGTGGVHLKADWAANRNFIHCVFDDNNGDGAAAKETQLIGWDPISGHIVSWHFDANGGYGYGKWTRNGDSWVVAADSVQPDGKTATANYVLKFVDMNMFKWQSTRRYLAGTRLPDTETLTVARTVPAK